MAIHYEYALDRTFHALGDGTRREMLAMLAKSQSRAAGELGAPFNISQPTASKHLRVLEQAGLVSRNVDGRIHLFNLETAPLTEAVEWITRHQQFWNGTLDRLGEFLTNLEEEEN